MSDNDTVGILERSLRSAQTELLSVEKINDKKRVKTKLKRKHKDTAKIHVYLSKWSVEVTGGKLQGIHVCAITQNFPYHFIPFSKGKRNDRL